MHFLKKNIECHFKRIFFLNKSSCSIIPKPGLRPKYYSITAFLGTEILQEQDYPKQISFLFLLMDDILVSFCYSLLSLSRKYVNLLMTHHYAMIFHE